MNSRERAKALICKIVALNGGRIVRMGHLYKAFHAAHLYYWEMDAGLLSDYPIVKMERGPGIHDCRALLRELEQEGRIVRGTQMVGPYPANVLEYVGDWNEVERDSQEARAILDALEFVRDKDTNELALVTHKRAWNAVEIGEEMDIYLDTLSESEVEEIDASIASVQKLLATAFR